MPNKTIVAMACLTTIIITCIFRDIDGVVVAAGCTLIAGLGGFALGKVKK